MMDVDSPSSSQLKTRTIARRFVADEFDSSSSMPELGAGDEFSSDSEPEQYPACLGDRSLEELIKGAKRGIADDLKSLVSIIQVEHRNSPYVWWSHSTIPSGVQSIAFKLFIFYIRNPYVPDEPLERKLTRLQLSATSLIGFGALGKIFFRFGKGRDRAHQMAQFWDDAFRWMNVLVTLHREGTFMETDTVHAACASMFLVLRDLNRKHLFNDPGVFALAFRLWINDARGDAGDIGDASLPLGIACSQMKLDVDSKRLLYAAVEVYEEMGHNEAKQGQLAQIAIRRLAAELKRDLPRERAICYHLDILWIFTKDEDQFENRSALAKDFSGFPSIVSALAQLAMFNTPVWVDLATTTARAIQLLQGHLCTNKPNDADRMVAVLRLRPGILTMMHHLLRRFGWLDDEGAALSILDRLLELLAVSSVLSSALDELQSLPPESDSESDLEGESDSESNLESERGSGSSTTFVDTKLAERLQAIRSAVLK